MATTSERDRITWSTEMNEPDVLGGSCLVALVIAAVVYAIYRVVEWFERRR